VYPSSAETTAGRRNVNVADVPRDVKKALGMRYAKLEKGLTTVRQDAKTIASATTDWKPLIVTKHPEYMTRERDRRLRLRTRLLLLYIVDGEGGGDCQLSDAMDLHRQRDYGVAQPARHYDDCLAAFGEIEIE
jgi:hypothetical protein